MTISNTTRVSGPYTGNGTTTTFPFTFKIFATDELLVVKTSPEGVETTLVLGVNYTAALNADQNNNPGGSVTLASALLSANLLTLTSQIQPLQPVDLTNGGGFYPRIINSAFDRLTILVQQLISKMSRAVTFPLSDGPISSPLPTKIQRLGRLLAFDSVNGDPSAGPLATSISTVTNNIYAIDTVASVADDVVTVAQNVDGLNYAKKYLGAASFDPVTRNDGSPLVVGDKYYNTSSNAEKTWNSGWFETPQNTDQPPGSTQMRTAAFSFARPGVYIPSLSGSTRKDFDYLKEITYFLHDPNSGEDVTGLVQDFLEKCYLIALSLKNTALTDQIKRQCVKAVFPLGKYYISSPIVVPPHVNVDLRGYFVRMFPVGGGTDTFDGNYVSNALGNLYQPALIVGLKSALENANVYCNPTASTGDAGSGVAVGKNWTATALSISAAGTGYTVGDVLTTANYDTAPYYGASVVVSSVGGAGQVTGVTFSNGGAYSMPIKMQQRVWTAGYGFSIFSAANPAAYVTTGGTGAGCTLVATWSSDFPGAAYYGGQDLIGDTYLGNVLVRSTTSVFNPTYGGTFCIKFSSLNHEFNILQTIGGYFGVAAQSAADIRGNVINCVLPNIGVNLFGVTGMTCPNVVLDSCVSANIVADQIANVDLRGTVFFAITNSAAYPTAPSSGGYAFRVGEFSSSSRCNNNNFEFIVNNQGIPNNPGSPLAFLSNCRGSKFTFNVANSSRTGSNVTGPYQNIRFADIGENFESSNELSGKINNCYGALFGGAEYTSGVVTYSGPARVVATFSGQPTAGDQLVIGGYAITFVASGATWPQVLIGASATTTAANLASAINTNHQTVRARARASGTSVTISTLVGGAAATSVTVTKTGTYPTLSASTMTGSFPQPVCSIKIWDDAVGGYVGPRGTYSLQSLGTPTSATGQNKAAKASICMDVSNANQYINVGTELTPDWRLVNRA